MPWPRRSSGPSAADRRRAPPRSRASRAPSPRSRRPSGFPILAEPTSQLRFGRHDRRLVVAAYDVIAAGRARGARRPTSSCASATCRRASRCAPGSRGAGGRPDRRSTRRGAGTSRRGSAGAIVARRRGLRSRSRWPSAPSAGDRGVARRLGRGGGGAPRRRSTRSLGRGRRRSTSPRSTAPSAACFGDGEQRPARLEHAGPRRRGVPARRRCATCGFFSNRGANGIDGLVSTAARHRARARPARPGSCSATSPLAHDLGGLAALAAARAARCGSSSSTTAAAGSSTSSRRPGRSSPTASSACSRRPGRSTSSACAASSASPTCRSTSVERPRPRARRARGTRARPRPASSAAPSNVELHRRIVERTRRGGPVAGA